MTAPTLALGISAAGTKQVADLAVAVSTLKNNLAELAKTAGGSSLQNLDGLTKEFRDMRMELVATMQGLRTDLAGGFQRAFAGAAKEAKAGGEQVEAEVKKAAAKVRIAAKGIDIGGALSASVSGSGLSTKEAVAKVAKELAALPEAVRAAGDKVAVEQVAAENKQKALWVQHLTDVRARMEEERLMMNQAVLQYRAIKDQQLAAQITFESEQKALWHAHLDAQKAQMSRERFVMSEATSQFKAIRAQQLADQISAEEAQKARWLDHQVTLAKRLAAEKLMMDDAARQYKAYQAETFNRSVQGSVGQAMSSAGMFSSISSGSYGALRNVSKDLDDIKTKAPAAASGVRKLTNELQDAHSAARGLASGFGAMWLTWGNIAPLLAGAALSTAFVQTVKMGSEVQHTLKTIEVLSEETSTSVEGLNAQLLELARTGPIGPREIATAMKTLSLAGFSAGEVSAAIKDVMNFAVAGTTSIEKAADVMTTVGTAFKISAGNYNYVGDVISKAAAVSKSSVEGMGESFKTASVINSQYGVSLEDVGTGLAALANVGIQNTAAGTSLRNMYVDLMGRTPKVVATLKLLGVEAIDPLTGKAIGLVNAIKQLDEGLSKLTPTDQTKALRSLFTERGGKSGIEALELLRTKAKEAGTTVSSELERIRLEIENAAGFMSVSAARLILTPMNQMKSVVSSLQATLAESFTALQPQILSISENLRKAFQSEEFKNAIQNLGLIVANATQFVVEHANAIVVLATAYAGLKIVGALSAMYASFTQGVVRSTAAVVGETAATEMATAAKIQMSTANATVATSATAAAVASTSVASGVGAAMLMVGRLLPWIGMAVLAWQAYSLWAYKASDTSKNYVDQSDALISSLRAEAARLKEINDAKALGISLDELKANKDAQRARVSVNGPVEAAQAEVNRLSALQGAPTNVPGLNASGVKYKTSAQMQVDKDLEIAKQKLSDAQNTRNGKLREAIEAEYSVKREAERSKASVAADAAAAQARMRSGDGTFDIGKQGAGKGSHDNEMSTLASMLASRESALKTAYDKEMGLLDLKHKGELISEGTYQSEVINRTARFEQEQRGMILGEMAAMKQAYDQRKAALQNSGGKPEAVSQSLKNLDNDYAKFTESANSQLSKLNTDAFDKQQRALISLESETKKVTKTNEEYWIKAEASAKKDIDVAAARQKTVGMTEEYRAALEAAAKVEDQHQGHMDLLKRDYELAAQALADFTNAQAENEGTSESAVTKYEALVKQLYTLAAAIELSADKTNKLKDAAAAAAVQNVQTKRMDDLANTLSGKMADAILDGGQNGFKSLRDWAKDYFIKEPLKVALKGMFEGSGGQGTAGGSSNGLFQMFSQFMNSGSAVNGNDGSGIGAAGGSPYTSSGINWGSMFSQFMSSGSSGSTASAGGAGGGIMSMFGNMMGGSGGSAGGSSMGGMGGGSMGYISAIAQAYEGIKNKQWGAAAGGVIGGYFGGPQGASIGASIGSMIDKMTSGEKRSGAQYKDAKYLRGPSGGEIPGASSTLQDVIDNINKNLKLIGSSQHLGELLSGLESSTKGRGFAFAGGTLSGGATFGNMETSNRRGNFTPEEAVKAFGEELKQATLQALQAANVPGQVGDYLKQLGDVDLLSDGALDKALDRLQKVMSEKDALDEREFNLTHTMEEQLIHQRQRERDSLDEVNQATLDRVNALEDENIASGKLKDALSAASDSSKAFVQFMSSTYSNIRGYLDKLNATSAGSGSPESQLANSKAQFMEQLTLAKLGDQGALSNITGYADQVINAQKAYTGSGGDTAAIINDVQSLLKSLPTFETESQVVARTIREASAAQIVAYNSNGSVLLQGMWGTSAQEQAATNNGTNTVWNGIWGASGQQLGALYGTSAEQINATYNATDVIWRGLWGSAGLLVQQFTALDSSVNDLLDFNELKVALGPLASDATINALILKADTNGDGQLSKLEIINASVWNTAAIQVQAAQQNTAAVVAATEAVATAAATPQVSYIANFPSWMYNPTNPNGSYSPGDSGGYALGGAFLSGHEITAFANGGVVDKPTNFNIGLMGEVGPEAIMPLRRGPGGSLGVVATGSTSDAEVKRLLQQLLDEMKRHTSVLASGMSQSIDAQESISDNTRKLADKAAFERTRV